MNLRPVVAILTMMLLTGVVTAQPTKPITLSEALQLSLQNSKQLKSNQAVVEEASNAVKEAKEKKLPGATVSGAYMRLSSANIDMKNKSNSQPSQPASSDPSANQAMYGIVNLSQPLYTGGKIKYGIQSAKYLEKAARLDAEFDRDAIIQNTMDAYANLFKAATAVKLVKENLAQNHQRVKDLENLEKNGLLARNDLLKAQLQESAVELNLLDAENNLQISNLNMLIMLGLPDGTTLVTDTTGIDKKEDNRSLVDFEQLAFTHRKDKEAMAYRLKAAQTGISLAKADKLPSFSITGGYVAANIPHIISITNAVNIGVGVSYNIASLWKSGSKIRQAESRVTQMALAQSMMDDQLKMQVNKDYLSLLSLRKKIEVMNKASLQAKENYRIVKNKFDNQLATTTDLLEADVANLQASLNYTLARADAFLAYHKLLQSVGVLSTEFKQ
jgi:outer membrane protein